MGDWVFGPREKLRHIPWEDADEFGYLEVQGGFWLGFKEFYKMTRTVRGAVANEFYHGADALMDENGIERAVGILAGMLFQMQYLSLIHIYFSVYEEVGHGGAGIPACDEVLAVDMGCVGLDMSCTEYDVSICAKDSGGPYDYEMVSRLVALAKDHGVSHAVDIYPMYSSDVTVAWRAGHDTRGALIGPGVSASHGMEPVSYTHLDVYKRQHPCAP